MFNKALIFFEQQGAVLLLNALWPPGKGQGKNKCFLRGSLKKKDLFHSSSEASRGNISSTTGCMDGRRDEVDSQGRSSLFLLSPLIPCYPNTHRSSITRGTERNNFHICLIPPTCLPVQLKAIPFFVVALKPGAVVLYSSGESMCHKYYQARGLDSHWGQLC